MKRSMKGSNYCHLCKESGHTARDHKSSGGGSGFLMRQGLYGL